MDPTTQNSASRIVDENRSEKSMPGLLSYGGYNENTSLPFPIYVSRGTSLRTGNREKAQWIRETMNWKEKESFGSRREKWQGRRMTDGSIWKKLVVVLMELFSELEIDVSNGLIAKAFCLMDYAIHLMYFYY